MLHKKAIFSFLFLILWFSGFSISYSFTEKITWKNVEQVTDGQGTSFNRLVIEGGVYHRLNPVPQFIKLYPVHTADASLSLRLINVQTAPLSQEEISVLKKMTETDTSFVSSVSLTLIRKSPYARVNIVPVRWNKRDKIYEKLVAFDIDISVEDLPEPMAASTVERTTTSVLAKGDWYKIRIDKSGIFKLTYQDLQKMGFDVSVNPKYIAVYGNGGGTLPEKNDVFRYDDLTENPIEVVGGEDGSFDPSDYILFYGEGPVVWKYSSTTQVFTHRNNYYDNYSYYFITRKSSPAKRIGEAFVPDGPADVEVNDFVDYAYHEEDLVNIAGSGRTWYGELFDFNSTYQFNFDFPNILPNQPGHFEADFASVSEAPTLFQIFLNGSLENTLVMPTVPSNPYQKGKSKSTSFQFYTAKDQVSVKLVFQRNSNNSAAYLNYFDLNVWRKLKMAGSQMMFRKPLASGKKARYTLNNAGNNITIWDITVPVNPRKVNALTSGNDLVFDATTDSLHQFIAFDGTQYFQTEFVKKVKNQNLHSLKNIDYLIVTYPDFMDEANRLAQFHAQEGMSTYVVTPQKIYNEFSSGSQDITAIRDFVKMLYDNSDAGSELKYLLLFGDASYDYKDRLNDNTNYVPCWESIESLNIVWSIGSDDYYGYLDDGEGVSDNDNVDIGIGRFVVINNDEAKVAVDKAIHYASESKTVMGPWRNVITFVGDDGDNNLHLKHAEALSGYIQGKDPVYNIDKVYVDAYHQVSTPSGKRAPGVNKAISERIEKGTLIVNYSGHGGEIGWGHEQFLTIPDITSWNNYDKLPIFITATCEFSRFDDPTRISAGELTFLSDHGGAIAMFSTSRATFASSNLALNMAIYQNNIFTKVDGQDPCFGDVIRRSKILGGDNDKKFVLLGDPALKLAYTDYIAQTLKINQKVNIENQPDTLNALSKVRVEGEITDEQGNPETSYDGMLYPVIYDKYSEISTLGDENPVTQFKLRQNILFNGKATIKQGQFNFEFIVPKDIAYKFGEGRISYYLNNDKKDGAGYYEGVIIGGYNEEAKKDNTGPDIKLYMNDISFRTGDITDQNPVMLANVQDESGINTTGNGIGHDIIATLDGDDSKTYSMNQFYEANEDSYNSGRITYPFKNLSPGQHTLSLKVWDIYNNSSTAQITFLVKPSADLIIENLLNYPNPFSTETNFVFDHNQSGEDLDVKIEIFSLTGTLVKRIERRITPEGYKSSPISWDGTTDNGGRVSRGMYLYRAIVRNKNGLTGVQNASLVISY